MTALDGLGSLWQDAESVKPVEAEGLAEQPKLKGHTRREWHGPKEEDCPLSGFPGYQEALAERLAGRALRDSFAHDPFFGDLFPEQGR